ncbi:MFS family permease [Microbacterium endophyticum]|uniref:MFS family permease n=1 Tax=Microbacterium endophyticum TaxID=1526412 RepID=A0A7W4YLK4_9MICO|nr:MFS transporter [Microbacterium endophyticum]MBB2975263.1 MFS family permease [Microbacterium endophyticum]NIK35718.1 MFS family permease [Microbacterium endophyticum]
MSTQGHTSGFAPFTLPVFRLIWTAALVSNIGSWMQSVGAQWLLVEGGSSAFVIALVQTAAAAPVLLFAVPAGVIGEFLNRRHVLIYAQFVQLIVVGVLTYLTWTQQTTPTTLLATTFLLGVCSAVQLPAFQSLIPDIVPREMITDAASLSSISVNIARAIGPAAAGLIVAQLGVAAVFAINAVSFVFFLGVLILWRSYAPPRPRPEPFLDATRAGLRYVLHSKIVRSTLVRLALFLVPANALWALLPTIAETSLGLGAGGYGLLLGSLGVGSIIGGVLLPRVRSVLGANGVVLASSLVYGLALIVLVVSPSLWLTVPVLIAAGLAWLNVIAVINGSVQAFLPVWVRTRGLSIYQLALYGGSAVGATLAGVLASAVGADIAVVAAGAAVLVAGLSQFIWPVASTAGIGREIVPIPGVLDVSRGSDDDQQVLVLVRYRVPESDRSAFIHVMRQVEQTRYRTGARRWELYTDADDSGMLVEAYAVGSWREHLSQHESRTTKFDSDLLARARAHSSEAPLVDHYIALIVPRRRSKIPPIEA